MGALPHSAAANVPWRADPHMFEAYPQHGVYDAGSTASAISLGDYLVWSSGGKVIPTALTLGTDPAGSAAFASAKAGAAGIAADASRVADHYGVWRYPRSIRVLRAGQIWAPLQSAMPYPIPPHNLSGSWTADADASASGSAYRSASAGWYAEASAKTHVGARAIPITTGNNFYQVTGHRGTQAVWSAVSRSADNYTGEGSAIGAMGTIIDTRFEEGQYQGLILFDFNSLNMGGV